MVLKHIITQTAFKAYNTVFKAYITSWKTKISTGFSLSWWIFHIYQVEQSRYVWVFLETLIGNRNFTLAHRKDVSYLPTRQNQNNVVPWLSDWMLDMPSKDHGCKPHQRSGTFLSLINISHSWLTRVRFINECLVHTCHICIEANFSQPHCP